MSWQDELKELDGALAAGQISADEYRTRRDRVLAQASGQPAPSGLGDISMDPPGQATQVFTPIQTPPPAYGTPPGGFDRTQAVPPEHRGPGESDKTQVVSGNPDTSADRTQVVPGGTASGNQGNFPQLPPPPPWETVRQPPSQPSQPMVGAAPPWANEELPPNFGSSSWPRQGPEVFEEPRSGNTGKIILIIVAVVVVLAGAGGAIWYFTSKSNNNPQSGPTNNNPPATQTQQPTSTTKPPPNIPKGPFIELPGKTVLNSTQAIADAVTNKVPTESEAKLLKANGVTEIAGLVTEDNGLRRGIWAFKLPEASGKAALTAIDKLYDQAKFTLGTGQQGVLVRKQAADANGLTVIRAHYLTSDGFLVRVEAYGKDGSQVDSAFGDLLDQETRKFEPVS